MGTSGNRAVSTRTRLVRPSRFVPSRFRASTTYDNRQSRLGAVRGWQLVVTCLPAVSPVSLPSWRDSMLSPKRSVNGMMLAVHGTNTRCSGCVRVESCEALFWIVVSDVLCHLGVFSIKKVRVLTSISYRLLASCCLVIQSSNREGILRNHG